jgi:hypothetical protein
MRDIIVAKEETPVVGEDGELVQPDTEIDQAVYAEYVASVKSGRQYTMTEWDDSRIVEIMAMGCAVYSVVGLLLLVILDVLLRLPVSTGE